MNAASLGSLGLSWSATLRHCALAASALSLSEGGRHEGRDDAPAALASVGERVAHGMDPAALPGRVDQLGDGGLDALVGVGDDQLGRRSDPAFCSLRKNSTQNVSASEEPMSMPSTSAPPIRSDDADRDDDGHRNDTVIAAHF